MTTNPANFATEFYNQLTNDYDTNLSHSGVSGERLASRLAELSKIGLTEDGGSSRMGFSAEEREAKELVKTWMRDAGLAVHEDGAGNIFGRLEGATSDAPAILSGSHVDSVPNGGHFDGPLGVLAALEVAEAWKETGYTPDNPYEVVIFTDEEGSRFKSGISGSAAMVGDADREEHVAYTDVNGDSFQTVIERDGLTVDGYFAAKRNLDEIDTFVEVHIEQGKRLEKEGLSVGVVTGIAGPAWMEVTITGEAGHAGNTPMDDRADALIAASECIHQIEHLPAKVSESAVATVGQMSVEPNGINVIPGNVTFTVDIRDIHIETRDQLINDVTNLVHRVSRERQVDAQVKENVRIPPMPIADDLQRKAAAAVEKAQGSSFFLPSGAGHDAMIVGAHRPSAMLFVRSKNGISHNPLEWSSLNDCTLSVHALKGTLETLVK
ncbi:Zn-dependent hydrolase [Texcoconibacillus texcoconensis]|uniref:Allantoate deiminase n=1 Tax=Texcoconibacillus texcoconensis TaxID=1095777 RepID=A0A840QR24_9BACI|nr:Zn-dependent hydrolase [Texcoconibacillus texcoconensis]MBB5173815.1 allantoate deiminase [Texcoconibacillus texcoconensis]